MIYALGLLLSIPSLCFAEAETFWTDGYNKALAGFYGEYESISGPGSSMQQTHMIRAMIPEIIKKYTITSIFDLPCGDFNWMKHVDVGDCTYIGADVVKDLVLKNNSKYANTKRAFMHLDVTRDQLPLADLIICRDLLVHLSNEDIIITLRNFKKSGAKYLLTTTFKSRAGNNDITSGDWRPLNLQVAPFRLPSPLEVINERCTEQNGIYSDKSMALWRLDDINV